MHIKTRIRYTDQVTFRAEILRNITVEEKPSSM